MLISHLAEHTHNLEADPRASFIVCAQGPDLQAQPRVTLLGETRPVADQRAIAARYLRFYPEHEQYLQIGGFAFLVARAVAGALHPGLRRTALDRRRRLSRRGRWPMAEAEPSVLEHMNADHRDALREYCRGTRIEPRDVEMIGIDCDGFDVRADDSLLRFAVRGAGRRTGAAARRVCRVGRKSRGDA